MSWFGGIQFPALLGVDPRDYEDITISTTATGFTASKMTNNGIQIKAVRISVETAGIRYREDGSDPSSTVGHAREAGDEFIVVGYNAIANFRAIRIGAEDATLRCTYYY